jgi:serine phosphatase RsbU (regulator of sigma subunit)
VLYTDGITEARSDTDLFGLSRLIHTVTELRDEPIQAIADGLVEAAAVFDTRPDTDDAAVVVLRVRSTA